MKTIDSRALSIDLPPIANDSGPNKYNMGKFQIFAVPGLDFDAVLKRRETVRVEGVFTYDDGFGDIIPQSLCFQMQATIIPQTCTYNGAGFMPCDYIPFDNSRLYTIEQNCKQQH